MKCDKCGAEKAVKGDRTPQGWHWLKDEAYCGPCWQKSFVLRAITFPVVGPEDGDWSDLRMALRAAWASAVSLANWATTELAKADVIRLPSMVKCPPMPTIYLYGLASKAYSGWSEWAGSASSANSVLRGVEQKYRAARFDVIWTRKRSLPTYRSVPYPLHNASWRASFDEGNRPVVSLPVGGRRWTLRLKGGPQFHRQRKAFAQIVSGDAVQGEAAIIEKKSSVMFKMVAWFPRKEADDEATNTLLVATDPNAFLVCEISGRGSPFILNADHVKRRIAAHRVYLQRISEDTKKEKRWPRKVRRQINESREARCRKQNDFLDTWCHQASAMIAQYARRNRACMVVYDDSRQEYLQSFPWAKFRGMLAYKLDDLGIAIKAAETCKTVPEGSGISG